MRERTWNRGPGVGLGLWLAASVSACAARQYPLPMTAAELEGHGDAAALVAYLGQAGASASVCDLRGPGPHAVKVGAGAGRELVRALRAGRVAPALWRSCSAALLESAGRPAAASLAGDALQGALAELEGPLPESGPARLARLEALAQVYEERPAGLEASAAAVSDARARLERLLARGRPGPVGRERAGDLLAVLELERGSWQGRVVDLPALDGLLEAGDERTLRRAMDRLPDAQLRAEARRRVVRLHLRASSDPEVRERGPAVEERVLGDGSNPVSLAEHPPLRGRLEPPPASPQGLVVEQHVLEQTVRLLDDTRGPGAPGLLPALPLRGALEVELAGLSLPVTVCAPPRELDVAPCLPPAAIEVDGPLARVDGDGALRIVDAGPAAVVLAAGPRLGVSLSAAGSGSASWAGRCAWPPPRTWCSPPPARAPGGRSSRWRSTRATRRGWSTRWRPAGAPTWPRWRQPTHRPSTSSAAAGRGGRGPVAPTARTGRTGRAAGTRSARSPPAPAARPGARAGREAPGGRAVPAATAGGSG
jgi:hypothetical protein